MNILKTQAVKLQSNTICICLSEWKSRNKVWPYRNQYTARRTFLNTVKPLNNGPLNKGQALNKVQMITTLACYFKLNKPLRSVHPSIVAIKSLQKGWPLLRSFTVVCLILNYNWWPLPVNKLYYILRTAHDSLREGVDILWMGTQIWTILVKCTLWWSVN